MYDDTRRWDDACSEVFDPDYRDYPHLFETHRFTEAELKQHREAYAAKVREPFPQYPSNRPSDGPSDDPAADTRFITKSPYKAIAWSEVSVRKADLKAAGWNLRKHPSEIPVATRLVPCTWVDTETGEVIAINSKDKRARRVTKAPYAPESKSDRSIRLAAMLNSLHPDKQEFVRYILKMRSRRGGLVEPLNAALDRWIAYRHPETLQNHRARKRESLKGLLYKLEILADEQTLTREYQLAGWSTKADKLAEAATAATMLKPRGVPQWSVAKSARIP
jgi:hypothetical protein